jgi:peptidoglycan/xylan/chitin deacetylase (PgdA/CDA1 family)
MKRKSHTTLRTRGARRLPWLVLLLTAGLQGEPVRRGGLVLQFDDGWSAWRTLVAPELARVNGRATGFVNNQYIQSGRITLDDLRSLQDEFGWEIGTHTFNHHNAIRQVQVHGMQAWMEPQVMRALDELRTAGLNVRNLVFPFNAYTPEIADAVRAQGITSYRRADAFALAAGLRPDGSLPGTSFDLSRHVPLATLRQWVDMAHARGELLFLYGHRILPDEAFATGRVAAVSAQDLVAETAVALPRGEEIVLVPDMNRRGTTDSIGGLVVDTNARTIRVPEAGTDLTRLTAPGATFLIGPAYGTRLSDFRSLIAYAAGRLTFYTVADVVAGRHQAGGAPSAATVVSGQQEVPP